MCFFRCARAGYGYGYMGIPGVFIAVVGNDTHQQHDNGREGADSGHHGIIEASRGQLLVMREAG